MNGLSLVADGELFAVDVTVVQKVVRNMAYTPIPAAPDAVAGIANLKGGIVTLLSLAELLGRGRGKQAAHAVILKSFANGNGQMGLLVDNPGNLITIDESEILPPYLTSEEEDISFISGLAELDGKLYRIIDVESIYEKF
ncbi:MAG: chemotaxis protein CheW [Oscillospiraceae bacterium]|nr:chemotaxis protein CheW [Oscillospiraceae bacterium]